MGFSSFLVLGGVRTDLVIEGRTDVPVHLLDCDRVVSFK